jgi:AraC-like DNA-binding protein
MEDDRISLINDPQSPLELDILDISLMTWHCHSDVELIFVLRGEMDVHFLGRKTHLKADDIVLVNSGEFHELRSASPCLFVSFKLKIALLSSGLCKGLNFYCDSTLEPNKLKFYMIKHSIAELVKLFTTSNDFQPFFSRSIAYLFLNELSTRFAPKEAHPEISSKHMERFAKISDYISENYSMNLSLRDIAGAVGLAPQYVSVMFTRHYNMSFLACYNEVRLNHAENKLIATTLSIEQIAEECGFSDARNFSNNFRKKYGVSPSVWRKNALSRMTDAPVKIDREDYLTLLAEYLKPRYEDGFQSVGIDTGVKAVNIAADVSLKSETFRPDFKTCIALSAPGDVLYADMQDMLRMAQSEIGFVSAGIIADDNPQYVSDKAAAILKSFGLTQIPLQEKEDPPDSNGRILKLRDMTSGSGNMKLDTCFRACSFIKRLFEHGHGYDYFLLADEPPEANSAPFAGAYGLFTHNGIKKPLYHALRLLNRMEGSLVVKDIGYEGGGYAVISSDMKIQILLFNYEHFGELFISGGEIDETFIERYKQVSKLSRMLTEIVLSGMADGGYEIREYILNSQHGSTFDEWLAMGRPAADDPDIERLKRVCEPKVTIRTEAAKNGKLVLEAILEPLEMRLIELKSFL